MQSVEAVIETDLFHRYNFPELFKDRIILITYSIESKEAREEIVNLIHSGSGLAIEKLKRVMNIQRAMLDDEGFQNATILLRQEDIRGFLRYAEEIAIRSGKLHQVEILLGNVLRWFSREKNNWVVKEETCPK